MKLLNKFAEQRGLKVDRGYEIHGKTGGIVALSCACGGCLALWCRDDAYKALSKECQSQGLLPLSSNQRYSDDMQLVLFDPEDPGQVSLALKLAWIEVERIPVPSEKLTE